VSCVCRGPVQELRHAEYRAPVQVHWADPHSPGQVWQWDPGGLTDQHLLRSHDLQGIRTNGICWHVDPLVCITTSCLRRVVSRKVERNATLNRQREVIQTNGLICLCYVPFIIYLFHNFSHSFNIKTADFYRTFLSIQLTFYITLIKITVKIPPSNHWDDFTLSSTLLVGDVRWIPYRSPGHHGYSPGLVCHQR